VSAGADWVAASVRGRAIARRRVGAGFCERLADAPALEAALTELAETVYGPRLRGITTLEAAQNAVSATVLWQLRVLAGWMPTTGATLARALAAGFERANIVARAEHLGGSSSGTALFDLGALATCSRIPATTTLESLTEALRRSGWGDPGRPDSIGALSDVLAVLWSRRLTAVAPAARAWAVAGCSLLAARIVLVDHADPSERLVGLARPLIGTGWTGTRDVTALTAALPRSVRLMLDGVDGPSELWRAEARLGTMIEEGGSALLREPLPGPDTVLGSIAVLAVDSWRLRAALAAAAAGTGRSEAGREVTHAMA
jgi:hypothetical protein